MSKDAESSRGLCCRSLVKLQGEVSRWDSQVLRIKVEEPAELLSRTASAKVTVFLLASESPDVYRIGFSSRVEPDPLGCDLDRDLT